MTNAPFGSLGDVCVPLGQLPPEVIQRDGVLYKACYAYGTTEDDRSRGEEAWIIVALEPA